MMASKSRKKSTWIWLAIVAVAAWFTRKMWLPKIQAMMNKGQNSTDPTKQG